jgi:eukaryotic-like serine/threonine-protein kinase
MTPSLIGASERVLAFGTFRGGGVGHLTWFDRAGQASGSLAVPPGGEDLHPAISPNGTQIAVNATDLQTGDWDIWIVDAASGARSRLTATPGADTDPIWSPDGREIVFTSNRGGNIGLYRKVVGGSAPEERLADRAGASVVIPTDWTRDGKYILFHEARPLPWTVYALPMFGADRTPIRVLDQFAPYGAHVSPDSRWLAYGSFETGLAEIYVQRFLASGQKQQVSHGGGVHPHWTKDGRELVYWAIPGGVDAVEFQALGDSFRIGAHRTLAQAPILSLVDARSHYDVTRDGGRVILRQQAGTQRDPIRAILNWTERLKP